MSDYGGSNDGRCEFSFLTRCKGEAVERVTHEGGGWTYNYCRDHADQFRPEQSLET